MAQSAGLVLYRRGDDGTIEVLLVHPGGPFWARKDEHAWSIPKGEHAPDEDPADAAEREFLEEIGQAPPAGRRVDLGEIRQSGGKRVHAFAVEGDLDPSEVVSNTFELEWPRGTGVMRSFPEVDRAEWFDLATARTKLHRGQVELVERLVELLGA